MQIKKLRHFYYRKALNLKNSHCVLGLYCYVFSDLFVFPIPFFPTTFCKMFLCADMKVVIKFSLNKKKKTLRNTLWHGMGLFSKMQYDHQRTVKSTKCHSYLKHEKPWTQMDIVKGKYNTSGVGDCRFTYLNANAWLMYCK